MPKITQKCQYYKCTYKTEYVLAYHRNQLTLSNFAMTQQDTLLSRYLTTLTQF